MDIDLDMLSEAIDRSNAKLLAASMERFPVGCRVRVVDADEAAFNGAEGTVVGYDTSDHPRVIVKFDGIAGGKRKAAFFGDGLFDDDVGGDEIIRIRNA